MITVAYRGKWNLAAPAIPTRSIAIIGGGASGVLMAAHLLRSGDPGLDIAIIEKRASLGRGMAYSTDLADHVLNVRASNMSAFAEEPDHFVRWLQARNILIDDPATYFAPRRLYGEYLGQLLHEALQGNSSYGRLRIIDGECVEILERDEHLELQLADGSIVVTQRCVLATGHDQKASRRQSLLSPSGSDDLLLPDPADRVLIVGTGLSMVDTCLSLILNGHRGQIIAVSRRGLLPAVHSKTTPIVLQQANVPLASGLPDLVRLFRDLVRGAEARGGDWRDVVDGLRPHSQLIWQSWSDATKRQFFRHLKAWWDIHRHRMAPQVSERLSEAIADGRLHVIAGRVLDVKSDGKGFAARVHRRNSQIVDEIRIARIYDCAGVIADPEKSSNPLTQSLLAGGTARADRLHIGLDVFTDGALISRLGIRNNRIFAVGPLTRGAFLEIEAIPDIRVQCQRLAGALLRQPWSR